MNVKSRVYLTMLVGVNVNSRVYLTMLVAHAKNGMWWKEKGKTREGN